ncbi:MAG: Mur ligase family protein, partial [Cutibacterium sp.]|nr:Mur ligase family protein [Cutibacterium sp.]
MALAPQAFPELIAPRQIAAVTGTNGKTTTTHFLTAAVHASRGIEPDDIVTNADGANLHAGIVSALGQAPEARNAILEVDERVVADVVRQGHPRVLVLLNFSRDQLDRNHELTFLGREWREALEEAGEEGPTVVANAADPLIVWAAQAAHRTVWVDTKPRWTADSVLCPQCGSILLHDDNGWRCEECGLHQPKADWWVDDQKAIRKDGHEYELEISVPGSFNLANATCALAAATEMGVDPYDALLGMREVSSPAGRYATTSINDVLVRLMLSKNPAGWTESLPLATSDPLILAIDAVA